MGLTGAVCAIAVAGAAVGKGYPTGPLSQAQLIEPDRLGTGAPVGLAYSQSSRSFYLVANQSRGARARVIRLEPGKARPDSDVAGSARIGAAVGDPINVAFDDRRRRLLILTAGNRIAEVAADESGELDPKSLKRHDARDLGATDPQGLAVSSDGTIHVLDAAGPGILRVMPGSGGSLAELRTASVDLPSGVAPARGLAIDPGSGHLFVGGKSVHEVTPSGDVVAVRDLDRHSDVQTQQGLAFAPSGDRTDPESESSLYVADSGDGMREDSGRVAEMSTQQSVAASSTGFTSELVRTVDTSTWSPPSPDPSGLAYLEGPDRLMTVDGEVEETVGGVTHFQGANVWETTRGGTVQRTANISSVPPTQTPMTDEPTGVAFDPAAGEFFVTEDGAKRVYRLNPGGDGLMGTSDDTWTSFSTRGVGNTDPEGVAYDTVRNEVVVADGLNAEIYRYSRTGTLIAQFDVERYGVADPEAVEFRPETDTFYVLSNRQSGPNVIEVSRAGDLLQTISVAAAPMRKPAGMTMAPASDGSGAPRFYVADRGVDNDKDPHAIDGRIFEMTAPAAPPPPNGDPQITSDGGGDTAAVSVEENQTAATDVDATDPDGDPLTFSITGGADAGSFAIDGSSGVLSFVVAPDFEVPADADGDNVYEVTVSVDDGRGGSDSQALSVTVTDVDETPPPAALQFALRNPATLNGLTVDNEDLVSWDGSDAFSLTADGSDIGLTYERVDAAAWLDADSLLLSLDSDTTVPGIPGTVDESDIIVLDASSLGETTSGTMSIYFDGSDVGLKDKGHDVNALERLPDGRLLLSTTSTFKNGGLTARDEDVMVFAPSSLGSNTAGTLSLYFDGSDVGLGDSGQQINGLALDGLGRLYLAPHKPLSVAGVSGEDEDAFVFTPETLGTTTWGTWASSLAFDGSVFGLGANRLNALELPPD